MTQISEPVEARVFTYQGTRFNYEPRTLRFRPLDHDNDALLRSFDEAEKAPPSGRPLPGGISFVTLNVAHDCNMACPYCFAKQGLYGGRDTGIRTALAADSCPATGSSSAPSAWITRRRCARDYEHLPATHAAMVNLAAIVQMTRHITKTADDNTSPG